MKLLADVADVLDPIIVVTLYLCAVFSFVVCFYAWEEKVVFFAGFAFCAGALEALAATFYLQHCTGVPPDART